MITFKYVDKNKDEHVLEMPDPDWIRDYTKIHNVTVRRSMSGKIRTYVVRDRKYAHAIIYNLQFILHRAEIKSFMRFIEISDGHYVWTHGTDSDCGAQVAAVAQHSTRVIPIKFATGSINVGDFAEVGGQYYTIRGVSDAELTIDPPLTYTIYPGNSVTIVKQQMLIINNQQFDFGSDGRAAGDDNDKENPGHLENIEDETYTFTLSVLVIKT